MSNKKYKLEVLSPYLNTDQDDNYTYRVAQYDYLGLKKTAKTFLNSSEKFLDKYTPLLPFNKKLVGLGEGSTPLISMSKIGSQYGVKNLYTKNEGVNPTGCFKDRESFVMVNVALEKKVDSIEIVSSGNGALSAAAYANAAGLKCFCHIPSDTSEGKKKLLKIFGAKLKEYDAEYEDIHRQLTKKPSGHFNISAGSTDLREEGSKTIAYELFVQQGAPDYIVVPVGNGSLLYGIFRGFEELQEMGFIKTLPKMIGVEVKGFAPIAEAARQKVDHVKLEGIPNSIAEGGVAALEGYSSPKALFALEKSKGMMIEITDKGIAKALQDLVKHESFVIEPTSAAAYAALKYLKVNSNEVVTCVATANGYKTLDKILNILSK